MPVRRFPVRFTGANKTMALLNMRPTNCYLDVTEDLVEVRMSAYFRASIPRARIASVRDDEAAVWGWGVHGGFGTWLINGSSSGIVRIEVDPEIKARMLGMPVSLHTLRVALDDPEGLEAALSTPATR